MTDGTADHRETPRIRGTVAAHDGEIHLLLTRYLDGSPSDVWPDLTDSDRLERWIGRYAGDPASGAVDFFMTAEGEDVPAQEFAITTCDRPHRFEGESRGEPSMRLWFELVADEDVTVLTFGQRLRPDEDVSSMGPGWEYYLDRLVAVRDGRDASSIAWDDYYPALRDGYAALAP